MKKRKKASFLSRKKMSKSTKLECKTRTKERKEKLYACVSKGLKHFWASMTPEEKAEFCRKRKERQAEIYANKSEKEKLKTFKRKSRHSRRLMLALTKEEKESRQRNQLITRMRKLAELTPEQRAKRFAFLKNIRKHPIKVITNAPRINDYAGTITFSEFESLSD